MKTFSTILSMMIICLALAACSAAPAIATATSHPSSTPTVAFTPSIIVTEPPVPTNVPTLTPVDVPTLPPGGEPEENGKVWVEIDPRQCLENPWEVWWLESHDMNDDAYPRDPRTRELEPEEIEIIRAYYQQQAVSVFDVKSDAWPPNIGVCAACSCPEGYTLYILVAESDLEAMLAQGYKVSDPD